MTVQKTERRLPPGMNPSDFGQADVDGNYALISYLTDWISQGSFNEYVVFARNGAAADAYNWTITDLYSGEVVLEETTATGQQLFEAEDIARIEVKVDVLWNRLPSPAATLSLTQWVVPRNSVLEGLLRSEGASLATVESSRELVNELRNYILAAAESTGPKGIPPRFLAAIVYKEILSRPKDPTDWRLLFNLTELLNIPTVRRRELFFAAEEINNPNVANLLSVQEDNSLGVCQMKPQTLAMLLGKTPWLEIEKGKIKEVEKQAEDNWSALNEDDKIDLFNILRFPKSNIRACAQLLAKLKNREVPGGPIPHRWPDLTAQELLLPVNEQALKIIATEWNFGASRSPRDKAEATAFGGVKVPRIFKMPVLQHFFGALKVIAELQNIDDEVLECLSADDHTYFGGVTRVHGTITIHGDVGDEVDLVVLEVIQGAKLVATAQPTADAKTKLIKPFGPTGKLEITSSQPLFELPAAQHGAIKKAEDSELALRIKVHTKHGLETTIGYGPVQLLVLYRGLLRIDPPGDPDPRDTALGGDDWARPATKKVLDALPDLRVGDISKMNGGKFKSHKEHRTGREVDAQFATYNNRDAAAAQKMLSYLNDANHGSKIRRVFATFNQVDGDPFWEAIKNVSLADGRKAIDVIKPLADHETHFEMLIQPYTGANP